MKRRKAVLVIEIALQNIFLDGLVSIFHVAYSLPVCWPGQLCSQFTFEIRKIVTVFSASFYFLNDLRGRDFFPDEVAHS